MENFTWKLWLSRFSSPKLASQAHGCTPCRAWTAKTHRLFWWVRPSLLRHASQLPSPGQPQDGNGLCQVFTHNPSNRPAVELCWEQIHCFLSINNSPKCPPPPVIIIVNLNHSPSWCGRMPAPLVTLPKYLLSVGLAPAPKPPVPCFLYSNHCPLPTVLCEFRIITGIAYSLLPPAPLLRIQVPTNQGSLLTSGSQVFGTVLAHSRCWVSICRMNEYTQFISHKIWIFVNIYSVTLLWCTLCYGDRYCHYNKKKYICYHLKK